MRKLIAVINITLDGFCDHTATIADDETHQHYNELLSNADTLIFGRITYQLMESYWPAAIKNPTGNNPIDEFAVLIDNISKIVFSRTLKNVDWKKHRIEKGNHQRRNFRTHATSGCNHFGWPPKLNNSFSAT